MRGILPDSIIDRQKHGFAVPLARWFRGELAGFSRDILLSGTCRNRGIFDMKTVERLFELNARGRELDLQLWTMLSFELWCRRFLDGSTSPTWRPSAYPANDASPVARHLRNGGTLVYGPVGKFFPFPPTALPRAIQMWARVTHSCPYLSLIRQFAAALILITHHPYANPLGEDGWPLAGNDRRPCTQLSTRFPSLPAATRSR